MKQDFRSLANHSIRTLTPYQPGKPVEELERELGITSSIKLASNENPLGPSPKALLAAQEALANGHIYPDGGCFELKQVLSNFLGMQPEQITFGNGSENILELIVKAYLHKDDTAVISQHAFLTIPILIQSYGAHAHVVPAKNWGHDVPSMIKAIDAKTRVLFLVNPNNPTGTYTNEQDFRLLMDSVPAHVLVVVDEAYSEYIDLADYPDAQKFLTQYPNLVISRTFSKVYGLAAFRLGYAISSPEIADMLNRARLPFNVNAIAAKAGCAALLDQEHVKKTVLLNRQGMLQLKTGLEALGLNYIPSIGNFITVEVGDAGAVYQQLLLEGIIVRPLKAYEIPSHIRVTIGTKEQNERLLMALQKLFPSQTSANQSAIVTQA
jgi:histidinol-phosphate aminotransferase